MTESNEVSHQAPVEVVSNDDVSNDDVQLGLTPYKMYRTRYQESEEPARATFNKTIFDAYYGDRFSLIVKRNLAKGGVVDSVMVELLNNAELAHIFTGTVSDFDTIDVLKRTIDLAIDQTYYRGFEAGFLAAAETIQVDPV